MGKEGGNEKKRVESRGRGGWNFRKAFPRSTEFPRDTETYLSQFLGEPIKPRLDSLSLSPPRHYHADGIFDGR